MTSAQRAGQGLAGRCPAAKVPVEGPDDVEQGGRPAGRSGLDGHLEGLGVGGAAGRGGSPLEIGSSTERHRHPVAAQAALQLRAGPLRDHPPGAQDRDPVGELVGLVEVLGRQQHGRARGDHAPYRLPDLVPATRVEPGGRLVEEQQPRRTHQAGGDVEAPPHAARVRRHLPVGRVREPEVRQQVGRTDLGVRLGEPVEPGEHHEVLAAVQHLVERGGLTDQSDRAPYGGRPAAYVLADDEDLALIAGGQGGEGAHSGRLAGAVGTEQGVHGPGRDLQVEAVERPGPAERLDQAGRGYRGGHGASGPSTARAA